MNNLQQAIQHLRQDITGDIILPGDPAYDKASTAFITKGSPAVIIRPSSAPETAKAIAFARQNNLTISVRSGGHSNAGHSTNSGGVVIDLAHLHNIQVIDKANHIVRIGAGATWADVATALAPHNLAISAGDTTTVGVGGIATTGGIGWMVRKHGLTVDNLVATQLVTADSQILTASSTESPELFWALRGGGGNFGIATSFDIIAYPTAGVYAGMIMYGLNELAPVLKGWRDYMRTATEDLTTTLVVMPPNSPFGAPPAVFIFVCYDGSNEAQAMQAIDPLLHLGKVMAKDVSHKAYKDVLEEGHPPQGLKIITNNAFIPNLSDDAIQAVSKSNQILQIRSVGGAMNRVAADATAFAHRDSEVLIVSPTFTAPDATPAAIHQALAPWRAIQAFGKGAYANFFSDDSQQNVRIAYPAATYVRLADIKKQYDPQNIFKRNFNIKPAA